MSERKWDQAQRGGNDRGRVEIEVTRPVLTKYRAAVVVQCLLMTSKGCEAHLN